MNIYTIPVPRTMQSGVEMATQNNILGFLPHSERRAKHSTTSRVFPHRGQMRQRGGSLSLPRNEKRKREADWSGEKEDS